MDPLPDTSRDSAREYEFSESQNRVFERLANEMRWVSLGFMFLGLVYLVHTATLVRSAIELPSLWLPFAMLGIVTTLLFFIGTWTSKAAASLKQVVRSQGSDIQHLMQAMDNLRKKYSIFGLVIKLYLVFVVLALVVAVFYAFGDK